MLPRAGQQTESDLKQEDIPNNQRPCQRPKRIRKYAPGRPPRPKKERDAGNAMPDFLNIHEQTVQLAVLRSGWNLQHPHRKTTGYLQRGREDMSHLGKSIDAVIDQHPEFQKSGSMASTMRGLVARSGGFRRLLERLAWMCPLPHFNEVLLMYGLVFDENREAILGLQDYSADSPELTADTILAKFLAKFWELLPNLSYSKVVGTTKAKFELLNQSLKSLVRTLVLTAICVLRNIDENPLYQGLFSELQPQSSGVSSRVQSKRSKKASRSNALKSSTSHTSVGARKQPPRHCNLSQ